MMSLEVVLRLEAIGDVDAGAYRNFARLCEGLGLNPGRDPDGPNRVWVAEVTGLSRKFRYSRSFIRGEKDYSQANSTGSRGVYVHFRVQTGRMYEVSAPRSWGKTDRYFCRVAEDGSVVRMTEVDVRRTLLGHGSEWEEPDF